MFGRRKRDRWQEDGFSEEEVPEENLPDEEYLTDGTEKYTPIRDGDDDPEAYAYPADGPDGEDETTIGFISEPLTFKEVEDWLFQLQKMDGSYISYFYRP